MLRNVLFVEEGRAEKRRRGEKGREGRGKEKKKEKQGGWLSHMNKLEE